MIWLLDHWAEIVGALAALLAAASAVTRLTPSPKDDRAVARFRALLARLSLLHPAESGRSIKLPLSPPARPPHPDDLPPPR